MELYHIEGLSFAYAGQSEPALHGIDLTLHAGEFVTLCGLSGSGKSTLLRQLKTALAPNGTRTGTVYFTGRALEEIPAREQAARIGYVHQRGEDQLVTDRVWHELAFGPESLGMEPSVIRRRVAEIAAFFGLEELFHRETAALSGGQKQLVDLAAALVLQPDILLLDEPTAQLDPIAAAELLAALSRINRELGTGILLSEQRLEEALPISDRALVLDGGHLIADGTPHEVAGQLGRSGHELFCAMPAAARVWMTVEQEKTCPISVREGRERLTAFAAGHALGPVPPAPDIMPMGDAAAQLSGIWHRYAADAPDVLRELSLTVRRGELLALLGGNGAGKSTVLKLLAGQERAYRGAVRVCGRTALLPQDVQTVFARKTVAEDLAETGADAAALERVTALCRLQSLLGRHPYDLSGGEQQRAALAKLLLMEPELLLLDEPTRGLDAAFRQELAQLLKRLCAEGVTVVIVSHDVEFCAEHAARCALLFDGAIVSDGTAREFFAGSRFYTTAVNRMGRDVVPDAVTVADLITACGGTPAAGEGQQRRTEVQGKAAPCDPACGLPERARSQSRQHLSLPSALTWALLPLTLVLGVRFFGSRGHYALSLLLLAEAMLAFFLAFERRRPAARELVLLAVLCALGTAGRAAFFMLPQCKPVLALAVTAGAALGGESGFLVGAVTMLVSNMLFSQGPWTPWQMFGMGLCGFLAGCVFRSGRLAPGRWTLSSFGALCALVVYGPLLNASSALLAAGTLTREGLLAYCASGLPMDCIHAAATFAFAWLFSEPMMEKLARWQQKYG